ncbi:MAG: hypothetical protein M3299_02335 [Thermoproteota archaeon]|nr:hypothetical protein [Thermoproteota archaeon]
MANSKKQVRSKAVVYAAIGIAAFAIIAVILFSVLSRGTLTETGSNPFGPDNGSGPPKIILVNDGVRYEGQLLGYTFSQRFESFQELPDISVGNITTISTDNIVTVDQGSQIEYTMEGNPPSESQFDSLSVTAYTEDGRPVGVLGALSPNSTGTNMYSYAVNNLQPGAQYILISTATWLDPQDTRSITGYVYYGHRINVEA